MSIIRYFENSAKVSSWASMDAYRAWVKANPHLGEYVAELLMATGIVKLKDNGRVCGVKKVTPTAAERVLRHATSEEWSPKWPNREKLIALLRDEGPMKFREIQSALAAVGTVSTFWFVMHAIWFLEREGNIQQLPDRTYRLVDESDERANPPGAGSPRIVKPLLHSVDEAERKFQDRCLLETFQCFGQNLPPFTKIERAWVKMMNQRARPGYEYVTTGKSALMRDRLATVAAKPSETPPEVLEVS